MHLHFSKINGQTIDRLGFCVHDILIASRTHVAHLKSVLGRLQQAGHGVRPSKCAIPEEKIEYLGFELSPKGMCRTEKNTEAIKCFPRPTTLKEVKRFLISITDTSRKWG